MAALALGVAACAADTIVPDVPRVVIGFPIAPFEIHEECVQLVPGDRLDFRFEAQKPVAFLIYYKDGITFIAPVSRENVTEFSGIFSPVIERRYCLQWETGQQGAIVDYRIRLLRGGAPR
jgi:hypothetical protein